MGEFFFFDGEAAGGAREWKKENDKKMTSRPRRDRRGRRGRARDVAFSPQQSAFASAKLTTSYLPPQARNRRSFFLPLLRRGSSFACCRHLTTCNSDLLDGRFSRPPAPPLSARLRPQIDGLSHLASVTNPSRGVVIVAAEAADPDAAAAAADDAPSLQSAKSNQPRKTTDRTAGRPSGLMVAICR